MPMSFHSRLFKILGVPSHPNLPQILHFTTLKTQIEMKDYELD